MSIALYVTPIILAPSEKVQSISVLTDGTQAPTQTFGYRIIKMGWIKAHNMNYDSSSAIDTYLETHFYSKGYSVNVSHTPTIPNMPDIGFFDLTIIGTKHSPSLPDNDD